MSQRIPAGYVEITNAAGTRLVSLDELRPPKHDLTARKLRAVTGDPCSTPDCPGHLNRCGVCIRCHPIAHLGGVQRAKGLSPERRRDIARAGGEAARDRRR